MARLFVDSDRYGDVPTSVLVEAVHAAVRDLVRRRVQESGIDFRQFASGAADRLITQADIQEVEKRILDSGYRFAWSSMLSLRDRPEIYAGANDPRHSDAAFSFEHPEARTAPADDEGRELRGVGDNVVRQPSNTRGTVHYIRTSERVLELMQSGIPADAIAIIDDSGGTLTAPILEKFAGVICAGGTVRSHLGILTREYGIPCLMNARISGIREGDRVELETTAAAKTAAAYQAGAEMTARIWKVAR
jgi:phosphohistidine swiveling domain-containing protein